MKTLIAALGLALALSSPAFAEFDGLEVVSPSQGIEKGSSPASTITKQTLINPVGVLLEASQDGKKGQNFCTAFFIGNGRFLSAGHCFAEGPVQSFTIETVDNRGVTATFKPESVIFSPPGKYGFDATVIRVETKPSLPDTLKPLSLECVGTPSLGDKITTEGFPEDLGRLRVNGYVAGGSEKFHSWEDLKLLRVVLPVSYGNSGGPVLNEQGRVIGILVGSLPDNRTLSLVAPIAPICDLLGIVSPSESAKEKE